MKSLVFAACVMLSLPACASAKDDATLKQIFTTMIDTRDECNIALDDSELEHGISDAKVDSACKRFLRIRVLVGTEPGTTLMTDWATRTMTTAQQTQALVDLKLCDKVVYRYAFWIDNHVSLLWT